MRYRRWVVFATVLSALACDDPTGPEGPDDAGRDGGASDGGRVDVDATPAVDGGARLCTFGSGPLPRALELPAAEPNGVFDPSVAGDPDSGRLWMAYSGVTGPAGTGRVSTHLAYSGVVPRDVESEQRRTDIYATISSFATVS